VRKIYFGHGLGDCVHFACQLPLYQSRGHEIIIACPPDKAAVFRCAGVEVTHDTSGAVDVPWHEGIAPGSDMRWNTWQHWSKGMRNLSLAPLPPIGSAELLDEQLQVRLRARTILSEACLAAAKSMLEGLPRPVVLLHTHGNTSADRKNIDNETCRQVYRALLDAGVTLVLLDWDDRVPRMAHWRVRHLTDDFHRIDLETLLALIDTANLLIGIDSGPLHATRLTDTPTIGVWMNGGCPAIWSYPREQQVNIVVGSECSSWAKHLRIPFHLVECPERKALAPLLAALCTRMLAGPRYLSASQRAADVQLQHWVRDRLGGGASALGGCVDRDRSFDLLLRAMAERFENPFVVETGCIRAEDDFTGAGFSTYLFGAYLSRRGGQLVSVDLSEGNCRFARAWTECFGPSVCIVTSDSVAWLERCRRQIDVLYLDSMDTDVPGCGEHALRELQAALPRLGDRSVVIIDDTAYQARSFRGKGSQAVPWLLEHGWRLLDCGHQAVLARSAGLSLSD
jgi:hypothetical protein